VKVARRWLIIHGERGFGKDGYQELVPYITLLTTFSSFPAAAGPRKQAGAGFRREWLQYQH
jgi:hypothetical protein